MELGSGAQLGPGDLLPGGSVSQGQQSHNRAGERTGVPRTSHRLVTVGK